MVGGEEHYKGQWKIIMEGDDGDDDAYDTSSPDNSSLTDGSTSSSSDIAEDDASSSTPSSCSSSDSDHGPLYQLSELMSNLPIKRGLSKFYQGKSQSFTSLSRVASIEDLPKKETPYKRKMMKASKSYGNGLDAYKPYTLPKATISKKKASRSCLSASFPGRRCSFMNSHRPPPVPVQKKF